jgi:hypothetical protein
MDNVFTQSATDNDDYKISHPVKYEHDNNILLFPNTTFEDIKYTDCNDTIMGHCISDVSIDECISKCSESESCSAGYHVKTPSSRICVPIESGKIPKANPVYKLRRQSIYPEFDNSDVTTFIDTRQFPFPPDEANAIFYLDVMQMIDKQTDHSLGKLNQDIPIATFDTVIGSNIQLISPDFTNTIAGRFSHVKYRDRVFLRIPGTNFILSRKGDIFEWEEYSILTGRESDSFQLINISDENNRDSLSYGDTFYLRYGSISNCGITNNKLYSFNNRPFENLERDNISTRFIFSPRMLAYYCDNGDCKSVGLDKTDTDGFQARYKGNHVFVNPGCYNLCNIDDLQSTIHKQRWTNHKSIPIWLWIVIFVPVGIIVLLFLLLYFLWFRR